VERIIHDHHQGDRTSLPRLSCTYAGGHDSQHFQNGIGKVVEGEHSGSNRENQHEDLHLHKNKKLRESKSGICLQLFFRNI
jgi:hypothetical protein